MRKWVLVRHRKGGAFWLGIGRNVLHDEDCGAFCVTVSWGWDDDVPWSWLPTLHTGHRGEARTVADLVADLRLWTRAHVSWLGFTVGVDSRRDVRFGMEVDR